MRVTFVLPVVSMSGGIKVVAIHARALAARGHDVTLVSPPPQADALRRKIRSLLTGKGWPRVVATRSHLDGAGLDHRVLERWRPVTDGDVPDADVVVATWWETAEWVQALDDRKGAKVYFIQGYETFPHLPAERVRATYRMPLHKIVIAGWLRDLMRDEFGDAVADLVPNAVDRDLFNAAPRGKQQRPTLGFLYSIASLKGTDVVLEVVKRLRQSLPDLRVIAFGARAPVEKYPLDPDIEFHLLPPQGEIPLLYAQSDVWLTASRREGFNLPAMEAMACRTPVVATRTGWPEEAIVTGRNGVLADIDDVDGLARGASWVLSLDDEAWRGLSSRAHETVASSSWDKSARQFEDALAHACRRAARGEVAGKCAADGGAPASTSATR